jgi:hypothetical protein
MTLPMDAAKRKAIPLATGLIDYFPDALAAVAELSLIGGQQHNPGKPLFWDRSKSTDHGDCLMRHFLDRGTLDTDGVRHSAKVAWRALALLQTELEKEALLKQRAKEVMASGDNCKAKTGGESGHPMAAEALRDEYEKGDRETGV